MLAFKHTIVTIYDNLQKYLEYFQYTTVRGNKFQLGNKITDISRTLRSKHVAIKSNAIFFLPRSLS